MNLTATPTTGSQFTNWTIGSTVESTNTSYTFNATSNQTVTANFAQNTPSVPIGLSLVGTTLNWEVNPISDNITSYSIYSTDTLIGTSTVPNYSLSGLSPGIYSMSITATNSGGISDKSSIISYQTAPTGLQASIISDSEFTLSFIQNPSIINPTGFNIYINNQKYGNTITSSPQEITGLSSSTTYSVTVTELTSSGESAPSTPLSIKTTAKIASPSQPQQGLTSSCYATLIWPPYPNAEYYNIYQDNIKIATTTATTYTVYNLTPGTNYSFTITAVLPNDSGDLQESTPSAPITVSTPTLIQPQAVPTSSTSLTVDWTAPSDSLPGTTIYNIYANGTLVETTTSNIATLHNLTPDTTYSITIEYTPENSSTPQNLAPVEVTTPSQITLPAPTQTQSANKTSTSTTLMWAPYPNAAYYNIYQDNIKIATTTATTYTVYNLTPGTSYLFTITVVLINDSGDLQESNPSDPITVSTPTLTQPQAIPVTATSSTIDWPTPSDSIPGTTVYTIYANGTPIETTTSTIVTVHNLSPDTIYSITIAYTPENSSTPQDLDPIEITTPSQITSPAPTQTQSANTTATSTTLNWQPPSDIIPINTVYKVYVNAILVGTTPSPFYIVPLQPAATSTVTVVTSTITDTIPAYTDPSTGITTPQSYTTVDSQPSSGLIVTTPLLSDILSNDITPTIETPYSITLNWPSYPGALSYNIYQNTVLIDTTTATTYTINNMQPKTQYTFQITINTPTGEQDPFAPIIMTSPPLNTTQGSGSAPPVILCSPDHTQYYDPIAKAVIILNVPIVTSQSDLDTLKQQNKSTSTSTFEFLLIRP